MTTREEPARLSRDTFRRFANEHIAPFAAEADEKGALPSHIFGLLAAHGYLGSALPLDVGGLALDPVLYGLLTSEIGRVCSSTRTLLTVHDMVCAAIQRWGATSLKSRLLPMLARGDLIAAFALSEADAGSDPSRLQTRITQDGPNWVIDGRKRWISFGSRADMILVIGRSEHGMVAVLVGGDCGGLTRSSVPEIVGTRGAMMADLSFESCRVPSDSLVGRPGFGLSHVAQTALDHGRYSVAWGALGLLDAALEKSREYTAVRETFGSCLRDHATVRAYLTRLMAMSHATRQMCIEAGRLRAEKAPTALHYTMLSKYFASKSAVEAARIAIQLHGARGLLAGQSPERLMRDALVTEIIEGNSEIIETTLGSLSF